MVHSTTHATDGVRAPADVDEIQDGIERLPRLAHSEIASYDSLDFEIWSLPKRRVVHSTTHASDGARAPATISFTC